MDNESNIPEIGDLIRQIADLQIKIDEWVERPLDDKRLLMFGYIQQRLGQMLQRIRSATTKPGFSALLAFAFPLLA